jgi:hypothetical protein
VTSGDVTSGQACARYHFLLPLIVPPQMWLCPSPYTNYVLVSESILDQILYFRVSNFIPTLSDTHCKLEWELLAKYKQ